VKQCSAYMTVHLDNQGFGHYKYDL
jgi:hypothetical protein